MDVGWQGDCGSNVLGLWGDEHWAKGRGRLHGVGDGARQWIGVVDAGDREVGGGAGDHAAAGGCERIGGDGRDLEGGGEGRCIECVPDDLPVVQPERTDSAQSCDWEFDGGRRWSCQWAHARSTGEWSSHGYIGGDAHRGAVGWGGAILLRGGERGGEGDKQACVGGGAQGAERVGGEWRY